MSARLWIVLLALSCVGGATRAADFVRTDSPTAGIQEAIDALPESGGVVKLPAGEYVLRRSIVLRTGVTLAGAGPSTVLRKTRYAETGLAAPARQGSRSVRVQNSAGFAPGDQAAIRDQDAMGWNVVQAIIKAVEGTELLLDRPMPRTCDSGRRGFVVLCFPAVTCNRASKIVLKDLAIKEDHARDLSVHGALDLSNPRLRFALSLPFPLAAIHLVDATDSRVEGVSVVGWLSDGISLQRGANDTVVNCLVEKCAGKGIHGGGGLHDSLFSRNVSRNNDDDGFYFCAKTQKLTVRENTLTGNKAHGIGGLGDSGDKFNTVAKNIISGNGRHGIQVWDGESNTVIDNTVSNNSQSASGRFSGIWLGKTSLSVVQRNRCFDDQPTKTQKHGVEELADCRENRIAENQCHGHAQKDVVLASDQPAGPPDAAPRRGRARRPSVEERVQ
jgi:parallel beta-helix repeat protein